MNSRSEQYWRDRVEEARAVAETMTDRQAKRAMLQIAQGYERLAERTERTACKKAS